MSEQLLGQATIKVESATLKSQNGASINPGGVQREAKPNDQGGVDFIRGATMPSRVSCTLSVDAAYDSDAINAWENVTVTFNGDNGKVWTINGAWVTEPPEISNGDASITFEGPPAQVIA